MNTRTKNKTNNYTQKTMITRSIITHDSKNGKHTKWENNKTATKKKKHEITQILIKTPTPTPTHAHTQKERTHIKHKQQHTQRYIKKRCNNKT